MVQTNKLRCREGFLARLFAQKPSRETARCMVASVLARSRDNAYKVHDLREQRLEFFQAGKPEKHRENR